MEQPENTTPQEDLGAIGPGRFLQNARQNKKLRVEDVAIELRLTPSQVTALEEDDYSHMPEVTYVRGYLRNYARLLGLSPDEVLLAHSRITRNEDRTSVAVAPVGEREIHATGAGIKLLGALILLAVIGASVYWYLGRDIPPPVAEDAPEPEAPVTTEVPTGTSKLSFTEPEPAAPTSAREAPAIPVTNELTDQPSAPAAITGEPGEEQQADEPVETEEPEANSATTTVQTPPEPAVIEPPVVAGTSQLVIKYRKSCWTDIRDARGKKLVYKTVPEGETIRIEGETPITLFFGFAVGVDLTFNGRPIDLKDHTRGVFARLTLGD